MDLDFESINTRILKRVADMPSYEFIGNKDDHWANNKEHYINVIEMDEDIGRAFHNFLSDYPQYITEDLVIRAYTGSGLGTNFIVHDSTGKAIADVTDYYNW